MQNKETNRENDTIAAISTPQGRGAISCVRLSGKGSVAIVKKLTEGFPAQPVHAKMTPCTFRGRVRDRILAAVYLGGKSYTGEESAELYFHGGKLLTEEALLSVLDAGARLAEPGEFTRRAFWNGKIDLTQAEGIGDLIDGDTPIALEAAYEQSEGRIKKEIDALYARLTETAAKAEVCIDYPEEDIEEQTEQELQEALASLEADIVKELRGYTSGRIRREGARVTLAGATNAGKSTLFNTLLRFDRAIVSDEAGTTRDTVEERMVYKGLGWVLTDTAGLRETGNKVEKLGIERSKTAMQDADVILYVQKKGEQPRAQSLDERTIVVVNSFQPGEGGAVERVGDTVTAEVNAATGEGVDALKEEIHRCVAARIEGQSGGINNPRHYEALRTARESIARAREALRTLTADCVCSDLREALDALGRITGKNAADAVIEEIFSRFCVGK